MTPGSLGGVSGRCRRSGPPRPRPRGPQPMSLGCRPRLGEHARRCHARRPERGLSPLQDRSGQAFAPGRSPHPQDAGAAPLRCRAASPATHLNGPVGSSVCLGSWYRVAGPPDHELFELLQERRFFGAERDVCSIRQIPKGVFTHALGKAPFLLEPCRDSRPLAPARPRP